jgi:hypothetical protein
MNGSHGRGVVGGGGGGGGAAAAGCSFIRRHEAERKDWKQHEEIFKHWQPPLEG